MQSHRGSGIEVSEATVGRVLRRNGLSRKVRYIAQQRSADARAQFMARVLSPGFIRSMFVFVDETGSDARNYMRKFGYSLRGMRTECPRFLARGHRLSAIDYISCTISFTAP